MKILPISDIHGKWEVLNYIKKNYNPKDFDFLTISGDIWEGISTNGRYKILDLQDWCKKPIVMCQGNHCYFDRTIFKNDKNIYLLHNETVTLDGVVFYGSPNTTVFGSWNWMQTEDNLYNIWNSTMPDKIDVAVMHQPPWGLGDSCYQETYGNNKDTHLGSHSLLKLLSERTIKCMAVGHIHSGERETTHPSGTKIYNSSTLDETYTWLGFNPPPKIIALDL